MEMIIYVEKEYAVVDKAWMFWYCLDNFILAVLQRHIGALVKTGVYLKKKTNGGGIPTSYMATSF